MQSTNNASNIVEEMVQIQVMRPVLRQGSKGRVVEELQNLLTYWGIYTGPINGSFELITEEGVRHFQQRVFIEDDGIVSERTWRSLYTGAPVDMPELSMGSHGELVMAAQRILKSTMDYIGMVDGDFGPMTESAVTGFQRRCELPVTGVIEEQTWICLSKFS